jgi:Holliday junction resolvase RusA-like endonuclease
MRLNMGDWIYMVEVPGDPIGKGRPRGASIGGKVRLYTPKKTADWERSAAMVMTSMWRKAPLDDHVIWKSSKPDADNICKCALDALVMAGVLRDDSLAVSVKVLDFYTERDRGPRLCLRMRPVGIEPVEGWWNEASRKMGETLRDVFQQEEDGFLHDLPW